VKIYFDNCCFNRPFDDQTQLKIFLEAQAKLYIQQLIIDGKYDLVWSYILDFENDQNPFDIRKNTIAQWKDISCLIIMENESIIEFAESLSAKGIKPKDALHMACAKEAGCEYFLTTDKKLLNAPVDGINVISPIELVERMED
jgi:predicted nucleic acid-binding protein